MNTLEEIVYPVVDVLQADHGGLKKDPKTVLFGMDAVLDSIALLTFLAAVEERVLETTGKEISLTLDTIDVEDNPLDTLGAFATYLDRQLASTVSR